MFLSLCLCRWQYFWLSVYIYLPVSCCLFLYIFVDAHITRYLSPSLRLCLSLPGHRPLCRYVHHYVSILLTVSLSLSFSISPCLFMSILLDFYLPLPLLLPFSVALTPLVSASISVIVLISKSLSRSIVLCPYLSVSRLLTLYVLTPPLWLYLSAKILMAISVSPCRWQCCFSSSWLTF